MDNSSVDEQLKKDSLFMAVIHQIDSKDENDGRANDSSLSDQLKGMFPKVFSEPNGVPSEKDRSCYKFDFQIPTS